MRFSVDYKLKFIFFRKFGLVDNYIKSDTAFFWLLLCRCQSILIVANVRRQNVSFLCGHYVGDFINTFGCMN